MTINRPQRNLYKIPHLSTMSYEDIKAFERDGVTPRDPQGGEDGTQDEPREGEG